MSVRLGSLSEQLYECIGRNDRSEKIVDSLHGRRLLFGLLAPAGIADHDRQVTVIPRGARVPLDTPVEMYARQNNGLDRLARQLERQLRADECRLQCHLVELVVAGLNKRLQFS